MAVRTCLATRRKADRSELIRLVLAPGGRVEVDWRGRLPGRGAWVTPSRQAVERLQAKPGLLRRALGGEVEVDGLLERVRAANVRALADALTLAHRAGCLRSGGERVRAALGGPGAAALLLASDASPRLAEDLRRRAGDLPVFELPWDREALGRLLGKGPRAAIVVVGGAPTRPLLRELRRLAALR